MKTSWFLLFGLLLVGCEAATSAGPVPACDHVITSFAPQVGPTAGGTEVTVSGTFVATESSRDVRVRVGGVEADVLSMSRDGCDTCDACANEALICATCDRECRGLAVYTDGSGAVWGASECLETLVFSTPGGPPGPATVLIMNSRGSSDDIRFLYEDAGDDDDSAPGDDDDSAPGDDDDSAR